MLSAADASRDWTLEGITTLDSFGATMLWRAWGRRWPARLSVRPEHRAIIDEIARSTTAPLPTPAPIRHCRCAGRESAAPFSDSGTTRWISSA
jgi:hypothetical protein